MLTELGWKLIEKGARVADAWFTGWLAARKRWQETAAETQERHRREDAEHELMRR